MVILEYNLKGWAFITHGRLLDILGYLIYIIMNINENLKHEINVKEQLKLRLIQFDQPFHPVILYENYFIRIVMNILK